MANRKLEALKREKAGNMLTIQQLDRVGGGAARSEPVDDARTLRALGIDVESAGAIESAWEKVGVTVQRTGQAFAPNRYFFDGKEVSRSEAVLHATTATRRRA